MPEATAMTQTMPDDVLISVRNLKKYFPIQAGWMRRKVGDIKAIDDVSLDIRKGETFGLVGESGSGKSTVARLMLRAYSLTDGQILFRQADGSVVDLSALSDRQMRSMRREMQMIFQDPYSSLNPTMTVGEILTEPLRLHRLAASGAAVRDRVAELLRIVGLDPAHARRYPHEFSGGQRQRIGIARALAVEPRLIVCDEAVSALDVSVQAQVINLMMDLQRRFGLAYVFIAHDLAVIRHIASRVAVMYLGRVVEIGDKEAIFGRPRHPYTRALLDAVPRTVPKAARGPMGSIGEAANGDGGEKSRGTVRRLVLEGDLPDPSAPPPGCRFHTRCPYVQARCRSEEPALASAPAASEHRAACHFADEIAASAPIGPAGAVRVDRVLARRLHRLQQAFVQKPPPTEEHRI